MYPSPPLSALAISKSISSIILFCRLSGATRRCFVSSTSVHIERALNTALASAAIFVFAVIRQRSV